MHKINADKKEAQVTIKEQLVYENLKDKAVTKITATKQSEQIDIDIRSSQFN